MHLEDQPKSIQLEPKLSSLVAVSISPLIFISILLNIIYFPTYVLKNDSGISKQDMKSELNI